MDRETEAFILDLLHRHNVLTLATVREDGWPQATTVGYVHDGLTLYVGCGADSQKRSIGTRTTGAGSRGCRSAPPPRS